MEKAKEFQKNIYFCFIDYAKAIFDCVIVTALGALCQSAHQNTEADAGHSSSRQCDATASQDCSWAPMWLPWELNIGWTG